MLKVLKSLANVALCTVILFACKKIDKQEQISPITTQQKEAYELSKDGKIILGKKLENPYSVQTMQKAYSSLKSKNSARIAEDQSPVRTTHLLRTLLT